MAEFRDDGHDAVLYVWAIDVLPLPLMKPSLSSASPSSIGVWIVEDDAQYRDTLILLLGHISGLHCAEVFYAYEEVQARLSKNTSWEPPDIVLMDIGLPGINGIEGISHLKTYLPEVPIMMLTINDTADMIFSALRAGASGYLLKSAPIDELVAAIQEAYRGGMLMSPSVARKVLSFFSETKPKQDYGLTKRETEVLRVMADGKTQQQIADQLFLSYHTIDSHLRNIYQKLHVGSGLEAVSKAFKERLI